MFWMCWSKRKIKKTGWARETLKIWNGQLRDLLSSSGGQKVLALGVIYRWPLYLHVAPSPGRHITSPFTWGSITVSFIQVLGPLPFGSRWSSTDDVTERGLAFSQGSLYGKSFVTVICIALNYWGKHKRKMVIRGIKLTGKPPATTLYLLSQVTTFFLYEVLKLFFLIMSMFIIMY